MLLKRLIALVLCMITTTVFANTKQELQNAFQNLNYDLTVEWDQKDKAVLSAKLENFQTVINGLKDKGVTNNEILTAVKEMIHNPKLIEDLELQASLNNINDSNDLTDFLWKNRQGMTVQGASWSGAVEFILPLAAIAILLTLTIIAANKKCTERAAYSCEQRFECTQPGYDGSLCEGFWYETCGEACLKWE